MDASENDISIARCPQIYDSARYGTVSSGLSLCDKATNAEVDAASAGPYPEISPVEHIADSLWPIILTKI